MVPRLFGFPRITTIPYTRSTNDCIADVPNSARIALRVPPAIAGF
jgi:hypothetical protein